MDTASAVQDIHSVNHVGMAVRDLAAAVARYEAMGFILTPYSPHSGAWNPGEPVQALRSGNRCVMFRNNYLEILASEDPGSPNPRLAGFLNHHQGAHIICFGSDDVHALDRRLRASGVETSGVIPLQRDINTPDGIRTARFERVQFAPDDSPEGYIQAARHLTPEYIYQERYIGHANGCFELSEVIVVTDEIERFAGKYARYLGIAPRKTDLGMRFDFSLASKLTLVPHRSAPSVIPGTLYPPIPGIAAVAFRTRDLDALKARLAREGFSGNEIDGRVVVPAEEACGVAVIFEG